MIGGTAVDKQAAAHCREIIARGAMDRPQFRKMLVGSEDLLHHYIQRLGVFLRRIGGEGRRHGLQALKVLLRCVQTVRMIDAQPIHVAAHQQLAHQPVRALEHFRVVHA